MVNISDGSFIFHLVGSAPTAASLPIPQASVGKHHILQHLEVHESTLNMGGP